MDEWKEGMEKGGSLSTLICCHPPPPPPRYTFPLESFGIPGKLGLLLSFALWSNQTEYYLNENPCSSADGQWKVDIPVRYGVWRTGLHEQNQKEPSSDKIEMCGMLAYAYHNFMLYFNSDSALATSSYQVPPPLFKVCATCYPQPTQSIKRPLFCFLSNYANKLSSCDLLVWSHRLTVTIIQ